MNRRTFLAGVGSAASLGVVFSRTRDAVDGIAIRFWLSEAADEYDAVGDRVRSYLEFAFDLEFWSVDVSYGGVVAVETEDGYDATMSGEWPSTVAAGAGGLGSVDPVRDVNLLVTDGQIRTAPTGAGVPHVASVGGAAAVGSLPPVDERPSVVPYSTPDRVMQVVVHEVGHALGLDHEHGVAVRRGDAVVATPMLSAYAWDADYDADRSHCGSAYPDTEGRDRALTYEFSSCAKERLREYSGGFVP